MKAAQLFAVVISLIGCGQGAGDMVTQRQVPIYEADVTIATEHYALLLGEIDTFAATFRLKRFAAAPGLRELKNRDVLFAVYKQSVDAKLAALSLTDVKDKGRISIAVYGEYFEDEAERRRFQDGVVSIVSSYADRSR